MDTDVYLAILYKVYLKNEQLENKYINLEINPLLKLM